MQFAASDATPWAEHVGDEAVDDKSPAWSFIGPWLAHPIDLTDLARPPPVVPNGKGDEMKGGDELHFLSQHSPLLCMYSMHEHPAGLGTFVTAGRLRDGVLANRPVASPRGFCRSRRPQRFGRTSGPTPSQARRGQKKKSPQSTPASTRVSCRSCFVLVSAQKNIDRALRPVIAVGRNKLRGGAQQFPGPALIGKKIGTRIGISGAGQISPPLLLEGGADMMMRTARQSW
jgi:hypothetical protein